MSAATTTKHELKCMEIWSGHRSVENVAASPGLDAWIFSQPYQGEATGGDVHYLSLCVGGIVTRLVLADVSGHGSVVAETSATLRTLLRRFMNAKRQDRLVGEINREFTTLEQTGRFATAIVMTYLSHRNSLLLTNAGHPHPLLYRHLNHSWSLLEPQATDSGSESTGLKNMPCGIVDSSAYSNVTLPIIDGDMLVLYTDAFSEARNSDNQMLGEEGLLKLANSLPGDLPCEEFGRRLRQAVAEFSMHFSSDDETLIVIRFGKGRKSPGLKERLHGYKSLLFGVG